MTLLISKMMGKLEGFQAISTNTLTNTYCQDRNANGGSDNICSHCYSVKALDNGYRPGMAPALQRNSDLLSSSLLKDSEVPFINAAYFRFSAHGELINDTHMSNLILICQRNPRTTFALWTKRVDIVRRVINKNGKPDNLILIYSNPKIGHIMKTPPRGFDRTFNNVDKGEHVERQNCTGQRCKDCLLCYTPDNGVTTIIEAVKK